MKIYLITCVTFFLLVSGCKDNPGLPLSNKKPKTYLWLFPDSTLAGGTSKQHIRWWGDDPDGIVIGYLFAAGKLLDSTGHIADTVGWRWRVESDTLVAFPLLKQQDTFQVAARAVDNTFSPSLIERIINDTLRVDGALIRLTNPPYWDVNENGRFDVGDVSLPSLSGAIDPKGAILGLPVINQPPSVIFVQDPNDPTVTMQQPETTYTAATFSWVGTDPDGDQTIRQYEIALNDPTDTARWLVVPGKINLVSLVVPRTRSDNVVGEVTADVYAGTFQNVPSSQGAIRLIGSISHLKLDSLNTFYVRARDVAGAASPIIQMPAGNATRKWFVKNPRGKLLMVNDFITNVSGDRNTVLLFYDSVFTHINLDGRFGNFDVLDIGRYNSPLLQWARLKQSGQFGVMVPPFLDPALVFTLHLFDVVFWYTDPFPSLGVAQYPLYEYVHDVNHQGKVVFSTMFLSSIDPRGALRDFAPIDSISSVDLATSPRPLPTSGDTRIPAGYTVDPDSSDLSNIYPVLKFPNGISSTYMRPIYKRADAKYVYHIQNDIQSPPRYVNLATLGELKSISAFGSSAWACGLGGIIFHTSNAGQNWAAQTSGTTNSLYSIHFRDDNNGWAVGDLGTILLTTNGGATWNKHSVATYESLLGVSFATPANGVTVGSNGIILRSTNGGASWFAPEFQQDKTIRSINFLDATTGLAVGDAGLIIKTSDGGATWRQILPLRTSQNLNAVRFTDAFTAWAVGSSGTNLKSVDGGESWGVQDVFSSNTDLRSLYFIDNNTGWICGSGGHLFRTTNGGSLWSASGSGVAWNLNGIVFTNGLQGWSVGANGMILRTESGDSGWFTQPRGSINVGIIDGIGIDGHRSFVFLGLPLHQLNGDGTNVKLLLEHVLHDEFGK